MNEGIGAKGGKKDRKLTFLNRRRKEQLKQQELLKKKGNDDKDKKKEKIFVKDITSEERETIIQPNEPKLETDDLVSQTELNKKILIKEKSKPKKEQIVNKESIDSAKENKNQEEQIENLINFSKKKKKKKGKNNTERIISPPLHQDKEIHSLETENKVEEFLEKQVIKVLEEDIQEKKYQLKKIDSEIYAIQKSIDSTNEEELIEIEKEIEKLMDMIEQIKKQILSLEKTFDLKFPVEEPDNYLIYLVEEYIHHRKEEKEFYKKLQDNQEFQSLIDIVIEIEEKQELIREKALDKREQLELEEEQVEKMADEVIEIEKINKSVKMMIENHEKTMEEIKIKVNETVHITERVEFITKSVNHTIFELFLLMAVLKHNLSIKNNAIAAASAALALDMIIKMTTPIQERVTVKDNDFKNYEDMIRKCINDTGFLEQMIGNNLEHIASIRYIFEKDYGSCSYLPSYQEALKRLTSLEDEMKERKDDVVKMKRDIELQLEKNNAKVKKYGSMKAA